MLRPFDFLTAAESLENEYARSWSNRIGETPAISDALFFDEDVDVSAQAATFVANIEANSRCDVIETGDDFSNGRAIDLDVDSLEIWKELVEVPRQLN